MTNKTLFIHAGGSKTGSSALQNFFELNFSRLESHGFSYEHKLNIKSEYQITSGNGEDLYNALKVENTTDVTIDNLALSYFGRSNNAICSSEYFQLLNVRAWRKLKECSKRIGFNLKIIMYVRNAIPFFLASYDQSIKAEGQRELFDEWVMKQDWQHISFLGEIKDVFPISDIYVLSYDRVKSELFKSFIDILGIVDSFEIDENKQRQKVNRSLSPNERDILLKTNKLLGSAFSGELSSLLINSNSNKQIKATILDMKIQTKILNRFRNEIDWVNNSFFNGQSIISVYPVDTEVKFDLNLSENIYDVQNIVLDWALKKLESIQKETESRILKHLNNAVSQNGSKNYSSEIPADFDALAYLLLNSDVLFAVGDPIEHFIAHGKTEDRKYRF